MVDEVMYTLLGVSTVFFVTAQFFLAFPLMRRRRQGGNGGFTPPSLMRMPGIAAILAVAALVIADTTVLALSERDWFRLHSAPPANALEIQVVGRQFQWYFRYPGPDGRLGRVDPGLISPGNPLGQDPADPAGADDVVTANDLHLIVGRPVAFHITSLDVLHSFNLPNFRIKQDAVPGGTVTVWTTPDRAGAYEIACAQLCGVGHYLMRGAVTVESPEAFAAWIAAQEAVKKSALPAGQKPK
jgi:cytochrome c oxidase subunit 2